jgi:hypothetical protein
MHVSALPHLRPPSPVVRTPTESLAVPHPSILLWSFSTPLALKRSPVHLDRRVPKRANKIGKINWSTGILLAKAIQ